MKRFYFEKNTLMLFMVCAFLVSCNDKVEEDMIETTSPLNKEVDSKTISCGYVDGYWNSTSYLSNFIINQNQTNWIFSIANNLCSMWGITYLELGFVKDNVYPNSTFNAMSYSNNKIYFGERLYRVALSRGQIVPAFIMAHEIGHQLQYKHNIPTVQENTARATELEADGFAGYYMRRPNGYNANWSQAGPGFEFAAELGDNFIYDANHHGTRAQRRSATRLGWYLGAYNLDVYNFDFNFFYYYQYVLGGQFKSARPSSITTEMHNDIMSKMDELKKINSGEIDKSEFEQLN